MTCHTKYDILKSLTAPYYQNTAAIPSFTEQSNSLTMNQFSMGAGFDTKQINCLLFDICFTSCEENNTNVLTDDLICDIYKTDYNKSNSNLSKTMMDKKKGELFWFCGIDSSVKYSDSAESQSLKDAMLKFANGPWAQAMSFLDGHGVLAAYPTVHFALIVSGSVPLLWNGQAGGGGASHSALASLHDIKVTGFLRATWHLNFAGWIKRVRTKIIFSKWQ